MTYPRMIKNATLCVGLVLLLRICLKSNFLLPRNNIPAHLLNHEIHVQRNLLSPQIGHDLRNLVKEIGVTNGYPTNVVDTSFYHTEHEHVGEALPAVILPDGSVVCDNPFLVPSINRTMCVMAGRMDIGKHLILTGGARGLRESYAKIISRVQSFGAYHFDLDAYPVVSNLFKEQKFIDTALKVCPTNKKYLDPFQFNFIIQVPGQTVATHIDGVYFKGASRFQFPQWLLAAMKFSGMWEDHFVNQVQVVGYLHEWMPEVEKGEKKAAAAAAASSIDQDAYGSFVYWNNKNPRPQKVLPYPLSGNVVDGSKVVHAASVYRKNAELPMIDKSMAHWLKKKNQDSDVWTISNMKDGIDNVLKEYTFNDLRISIVYRARCFENEQEAIEFREQLHGKDGEDGRYSMEEILTTFVNDLVHQGYLSATATLDNLNRLELAMLIMKVYIKYPLPSTPVIPWNYCAADKLVGWLKYPLSFVCS